jgi:hypothetical protein
MISYSYTYKSNRVRDMARESVEAAIRGDEIRRLELDLLLLAEHSQDAPEHIRARAEWTASLLRDRLAHLRTILQ